VFGISLGEIAVIALVVLIVVGPQKLPGMLRSFGAWMRKLRILTTEVRTQTGIDEILRDEGIDGGLAELRSMLRGDLRGIVRGPATAESAASSPYADPTPKPAVIDRYREFPPEGADAAGSIPDDLLDDAPSGPEPSPTGAVANE
jgi:sec-independent protein translocase protein TatB